MNPLSHDLVSYFLAKFIAYFTGDLFGNSSNVRMPSTNRVGVQTDKPEPGFT